MKKTSKDVRDIFVKIPVDMATREVDNKIDKIVGRPSDWADEDLRWGYSRWDAEPHTKALRAKARIEKAFPTVKVFLEK